MKQDLNEKASCEAKRSLEGLRGLHRLGSIDREYVKQKAPNEAKRILGWLRKRNRSISIAGFGAHIVRDRRVRSATGRRRRDCNERFGVLRLRISGAIR